MLTDSRIAPTLRFTPVTFISTGGPMPVPSPGVIPFFLPGSSLGASCPTGQAAEKQAVIVPMFAVLLTLAAALLAYSVTRNESDTSLLRCQPLITTLEFGFTIQT